MYKLYKDKFNINTNISNTILYIIKKKTYKINLIDKKITKTYITKLVNHKFNKLILNLMDLLLNDDDDSDRLILDEIEKFRLLIKNKYREFLTQKDLEKMSCKFKLIKKEINNKKIKMIESTKTSSRGK